MVKLKYYNLLDCQTYLITIMAIDVNDGHFDALQIYGRESGKFDMVHLRIGLLNTIRFMLFAVIGR
jgi:hypothetical protein